MLEDIKISLREVHALCKNVHGIVNLDIHMIANSRQLVSLGGDNFAVFRLDLVRRRAFLSEASGDDDTVTVILVPVCIFSLIFQDDRDFGGTSQAVRECGGTTINSRTLGLHG